jgi:hypothetical protein
MIPIIPGQQAILITMIIQGNSGIFVYSMHEESSEKGRQLTVGVNKYFFNWLILKYIFLLHEGMLSLPSSTHTRQHFSATPSLTVVPLVSNCYAMVEFSHGRELFSIKLFSISRIWLYRTFRTTCPTCYVNGDGLGFMSKTPFCLR